MIRNKLLSYFGIEDLSLFLEDEFSSFRKEVDERDSRYLDCVCDSYNEVIDSIYHEDLDKMFNDIIKDEKIVDFERMTYRNVVDSYKEKVNKLLDEKVDKLFESYKIDDRRYLFKFLSGYYNDMVYKDILMKYVIKFSSVGEERKRVLTSIYDSAIDRCNDDLRKSTTSIVLINIVCYCFFKKIIDNETLYLLRDYIVNRGMDIGISTDKELNVVYNNEVPSNVRYEFEKCFGLFKNSGKRQLTLTHLEELSKPKNKYFNSIKPKIYQMSYKDVNKLAVSLDYEYSRQAGSHRVYTHKLSGKIVTVPQDDKHMSVITKENIIKQLIERRA